MKQYLKWAGVFLAFWLYNTAIAQLPVYEVQYDVVDLVEYYVSDTNSKYIGLYEKLLFMPVETEEHHVETIFDDGSYQEVTHIDYPNGPIEDWQVTPTRLITTNTETKAYVGDYLYSTTSNDTHELFDPNTYINDYLVAKPFDLPINQLDQQKLRRAGYVIEVNNGTELKLVSDSVTHYYNTETKFEEHTTYEAGIPLFYEATAYREDGNMWVYETRILRNLMDRDSFCIERAWIRIYRNFKRRFTNATEPSQNLAITDKELDKVQWYVLESSKLHGISVVVAHDVEKSVPAIILDMHGKVVLDNIQLHKGKNSLNSVHLTRGMYILIDSTGELTPLKFILTNQ
ncbi:MAG: hypothetical protein JJ975_02455 [Bacteroidia bacterium]|nr:hypothetical protein [Bacteroidia bacterium]